MKVGAVWLTFLAAVKSARKHIFSDSSGCYLWFPCVRQEGVDIVLFSSVLQMCLFMAKSVLTVQTRYISIMKASAAMFNWTFTVSDGSSVGHINFVFYYV